MKSMCLSALAALLGVGCSTAMHPGEPTGERRVPYGCANGEGVEMRSFPLQGVGALVRDGSELIIEIGRMVPIRCEAR